MKSLLLFSLFSSTAIASSYTQPLTCEATSIALSSPTTALVQCKDTPPPPGGNCTQGAPTDVPGYTLACQGQITLHTGTGGDKTIGPSQWSYSFVFGDVWPGDRFGQTMIFKPAKKQALSMPFTAATLNTIQYANNGSYTKPGVLTITISRKQGEFNNGEVGGDVLCANSRGNLVVTTNNSSGNCNLTAYKNQALWLNIIPAIHGDQGWGVPDTNSCQTNPCPIGITLYKKN